MTRPALFIALAIAAVIGLAFGLYPQLDLRIAALFFTDGGFVLADNPLLAALRETNTIVVGLLLLPPLFGLARKLIFPSRPLAMSGRAIVYLLTTALVGPLLFANIILKDHWDRPRPRDVVEFGGTQHFVVWWDPRGTCDDNCSFIAGEPTGAFWTLAPASLAPPQWRAVAYAGALVFGTLIGLLRMSFGGHFFTDVVFAGVLSFLVIWLTHGLIYRWQATRFSDAAVDRLLERLGLWLRSLRRKPATPPPPQAGEGS
jgi:membrane-associated PAP2 superfamily phosphatase